LYIEKDLLKPDTQTNWQKKRWTHKQIDRQKMDTQTNWQTKRRTDRLLKI